MEAYEFPNAEAALLEVVRDVLAVEASVEVLKPRPELFVQLSRVGGVARMITDRPMVVCCAWGPSWEEAFTLASGLRRLVHSLTSLDGLPVYRVREVGGLARSPDPVAGSPRYQFTAELSLRGSTAP
ncbi:hypothetical protein ACFSWE_08620 [Leucobacter albus]|uniref:Tail terminator n=1 Tax=Leucobacter albus TaxID=272210 RepID=A0ABW3TPL1_9MICO